MAELAGGGEPNGDDAAGAGAKGDAVADAGEPKRPPPAGAAPKGDWEAAPPPKGDAAGGATTPNGMGLPEAIGTLAITPAAIGTIEGISALGGNGTQPSLPQPVGGGLSSADATEYSMVGGWLERLEAIHHLPSRRMIVRDCEPEATLGSPTLM